MIPGISAAKSDRVSRILRQAADSSVARFVAPAKIAVPGDRLAFRARPSQKARMTKLPWLLFQLAIIGAWLCLDYGTSHRGAPPNPGLALAMGVATAFILTAIPLRVWRALKQPS